MCNEYNSLIKEDELILSDEIKGNTVVTLKNNEFELLNKKLNDIRLLMDEETLTETDIRLLVREFTLHALVILDNIDMSPEFSDISSDVRKYLETGDKEYERYVDYDLIIKDECFSGAADVAKFIAYRFIMMIDIFTSPGKLPRDAVWSSAGRAELEWQYNHIKKYIKDRTGKIFNSYTGRCSFL